MEPDEVLEVDTSMDGDFTVYNIIKPYKLIFISSDLLQEKLIKDAIYNGLKPISDIVIDLKKVDKIDKVLTKYDDEYYKKHLKHSGENIVNDACFMFVYDQDDKLIDVYVATPRMIINKVMLGSQEYKCEQCGKVHITHNNDINNFMPPYYYIVKDNKIEYFCPECAKNKNNLKHVGE